MKFILTIVYIILTTLGLFLMKLGGNALSFDFTNGIGFKIGYITFFGFLSYICSFLLWQRLLVSFDLSYIVPIVTGITQIIILLLGVFFFKEQVSVTGIIGAILVIIGIILMAFGKR